MCSPASATTVELPRRLLADRATTGLVLAVAAVLEFVGARDPGLPSGCGLAIAAGLALWHHRALRRRPRALRFGPDGVVLCCQDGRCVPATVGTGVRLLGGSLVLEWRGPTGRGSAWLTPFDVQPATLHALALRLVASRAAGAA